MTIRIGFIGLGEAGLSIARGLVGEGAEVSGFDVRSDDPVFAATLREAGILPYTELAELIGNVPVLLCLTSAKSALAIATSAAKHLRADQIYVDLNSTSPQLQQELAGAVAASGASFVDGAIMEAVAPRGHRVPMLLSGLRAEELAALLASVGMVVEALGLEPGRASAVKMCRSLLVKGVEALLLEAGLAAQQFGVTERVLGGLSDTFASNDWVRLGEYFLGRTLVHGERRAEELRQAAAMLQAGGIQPLVALAAAERLERAAALHDVRQLLDDGRPYDDLLEAIRGGEMTTREARLFIQGEWVDGESTVPLGDKFSGAEIARVHEASRAQVDRALAGVAAGQQSRRLTPYERFGILSTASRLLVERRQAFIDSVIDDAGFTVSDAEREVDRAAQTLLLSAEESKRIHGEMVPVDAAPAPNGRIGFTVRHPLGVVCAITPFNSPLNTVVHKIAPALAAGNSVILKPATLTPLSSGLLVRLLLDAGLPPELISLVHGGGSTVGQWLLESQVPSFYAFTGSTAVGEHIRRAIGLRKSQLELGSLSSTIVCDDAELDRAALLCVQAAFRKAGQVCTSVQRLYVQEGVSADFVAALVANLGSRPIGDPRLAETFVGPVISASEADRLQSWIEGAVAGGASVEHGGGRSGQVVEPTILSGVQADMAVYSQEAFGPIVSVRTFRDLNAAIDEINDTPYGLAAGVFTADISRAMDSAERLRMGSVHINETSSSRLDLMPYGGVKLSGLGLEGPRYAIEEMTEQRLITLGRP